MSVNNCDKFLFRGVIDSGKTTACIKLLLLLANNASTQFNFTVEEFYLHTPTNRFKRYINVNRLSPVYIGKIRYIWNNPLLPDSCNFTRFDWDINLFSQPNFYDKHIDFCAFIKETVTNKKIIIFSASDLIEQIELFTAITKYINDNSILVSTVREREVKGYEVITAMENALGVPTGLIKSMKPSSKILSGDAINRISILDLQKPSIISSPEGIIFNEILKCL